MPAPPSRLTSGKQAPTASLSVARLALLRNLAVVVVVGALSLALVAVWWWLPATTARDSAEAALATEQQAATSAQTTLEQFDSSDTVATLLAQVGSADAAISFYPDAEGEATAALEVPRALAAAAASVGGTLGTELSVTALPLGSGPSSLRAAVVRYTVQVPSGSFGSFASALASQGVLMTSVSVTAAGPNKSPLTPGAPEVYTITGVAWWSVTPAIDLPASTPAPTPAPSPTPIPDPATPVPDPSSGEEPSG